MEDRHGLKKILNEIGSDREVGRLRSGDELAPERLSFIERRWPNLAPWFVYGIYGLKLDGKLVYVGKSPCPIGALAQHRIPGPAWMGHVRFDNAWVRPSHPDRVDRDMAEATIEMRHPDELASQLPNPIYQISPAFA